MCLISLRYLITGLTNARGLERSFCLSLVLCEPRRKVSLSSLSLLICASRNQKSWIILLAIHWKWTFRVSYLTSVWSALIDFYRETLNSTWFPSRILGIAWDNTMNKTFWVLSFLCAMVFLSEYCFSAPVLFRVDPQKNIFTKTAKKSSVELQWYFPISEHCGKSDLLCGFKTPHHSAVSANRNVRRFWKLQKSDRLCGFKKPSSTAVFWYPRNKAVSMSRINDLTFEVFRIVEHHGFQTPLNNAVFWNCIKNLTFTVSENGQKPGL